MSKRTKKIKLPKRFTSEQLLQRTFQGKRIPGEEDFWLFSVVTDDPATPTWDHRVSVMGTYAQCCCAAGKVIDSIVDDGLDKKGLRVELYQGDKARAIFMEGVKQEIAYQQERTGQANN